MTVRPEVVALLSESALDRAVAPFFHRDRARPFSTDETDLAQTATAEERVEAAEYRLMERTAALAAFMRDEEVPGRRGSDPVHSAAIADLKATLAPAAETPEDAIQNRGCDRITLVADWAGLEVAEVEAIISQRPAKSTP